ncbi:MAG: DUF3086 domain-containing protein [Elainellaceae cyanobacterium]
MIEPSDSAETTDTGRDAVPNAGSGLRSSIRPPLRPVDRSTSNASAAASTARAASQADRASASDQSSEYRTLQRQLRDLQQEIEGLQETRDRLIREQTQDVQTAVSRLVEEGLADLEQRRKALQTSVEQLERRQERIRAEMRKSFVGVSQDLAVRVQGFKDYLVGSLQDLAATAEQLELGTTAPPAAPSGQPLPSLQPERSPEAGSPPARRRQRPAPERPPLERPPSERRPGASRPLDLQPPRRTGEAAESSGARPAEPQPGRRPAGPVEQPTSGEADRIRQLLAQYRTMPNYYGRPWQLRRTFEPVHAERASQWFFDLGQRGAIKTMGSRLQNVLVAAAVISALRELHGDRVRALILGDSPERLGEWRRGLQDCLGISRTDFGAQRGIVLFEAPEAVAQRAERLVEQGQMPLIFIDEGEDKVSLSLLQFPRWLAFAPDPSDPLPFY